MYLQCRRWCTTVCKVLPLTVQRGLGASFMTAILTFADLHCDYEIMIKVLLIQFDVEFSQ